MSISKKGIELDLGLYLILIGLFIMMLGIPVEGLKQAAIVSVDMPGGGGAIEGIKPVTAAMIGVGAFVTLIGLLIEYKTSNNKFFKKRN